MTMDWYNTSRFFLQNTNQPNAYVVLKISYNSKRRYFILFYLKKNMFWIYKTGRCTCKFSVTSWFLSKLRYIWNAICKAKKNIFINMSYFLCTCISKYNIYNHLYLTALKNSIIYKMISILINSHLIIRLKTNHFCMDDVVFMKSLWCNVLS